MVVKQAILQLEPCCLRMRVMKATGVMLLYTQNKYALLTSKCVEPLSQVSAHCSVLKRSAISFCAGLAHEVVLLLMP